METDLRSDGSQHRIDVGTAGPSCHRWDTYKARVMLIPVLQGLPLKGPQGGHIMPYLLGWLLGVPLVVLVILYLIFH
jgi:hypothetical protein